MSETSDIKSAGMRIYTWAWDGHSAAKPGEKLTVGVDIVEAQVHNLAGDTLAVLETLPYEMYAEKGLKNPPVRLGAGPFVTLEVESVKGHWHAFYGALTLVYVSSEDRSCRYGDGTDCAYPLLGDSLNTR